MPDYRITEEELETLAERVAVKTVIALHRECRFRNIPPEWERGVEHVVGVIHDIGGGDIDHGAEILRDHHKALRDINVEELKTHCKRMTKMQCLYENVGHRLASFLTVSLVGLILSAIALGALTYFLELVGKK